MNFLTAQQEVGVQLGLNYADVTQGTAVKRWLNMAYQDIVGKYSWSWLKDYTTVTMVTDNSVTATVASGSTSVTLSATIATSQAGRSIQFTGGNAWYRITAHVAGSATLTIDPAYAPSVDLTAGTAIIRTINYSLPNTVEYVYGARSTIFPWQIEVVDRTRYNQFSWLSYIVGPVRAIIPNGQDSSGNWTFTPYPFPNDNYVLEMYFVKKITELSADSDTPLFPSRFDSIWIEGAIAYGFRFLDDDRYTAAYKKFEDKVLDMFGRDNPMQNQMWILRPFDDQPSARGINFPAAYGPNLR